ncbi:BA75_00832T0 [Komagataella pastoris]|uniref:Protein transport protein SEC31 n=1 Tax=Komagataella pastoris TaxID=4922 RepID=A0A1B2J560_PICPA|nr:BA75_00832T0 [Komagataella pastoris]
MVKISEIKSTSTFAWSSVDSNVLATGTLAGAVDDSFSTTSSLELWDVLNTSAPIFRTNVGARFHDLAWTNPVSKYQRGLLAGAFDNGTIQLWDSSSLLNGSSDNLIDLKKHTAPVKTVSFNPTESQIFASGASNGQLFIWDLNHLSEPISPGASTTPINDINSIAWNSKIRHILASAGTSGYASIWDLKTKKELLNLSYTAPSGQRANLSTVAWHPTNSTSVITASDSDAVPLIMTWDLRNTNVPVATLEGHQKGVLSLDWCSWDPELLLSSGKDNSTLLWNPIRGSLLAEYPTTTNWAFKTRFSPKLPDIFATSSFDGKISVQTLQDTTPVETQQAKAINDDEFWADLSNSDKKHPNFLQHQTPAWLKVPSSVSFGFGGKIVKVSKTSDNQSIVVIDSFTTNDTLAKSTSLLANTISTNDYQTLVDEKLRTESNNHDWQLLNDLLKADDVKDYFRFQIVDPSILKHDKSEQKAENGQDILENTEQTDEDFFNNLEKENNSVFVNIPSYSPTGEFDVSSLKDQTGLAASLLLGDLEKATEIALSQGLIQEALVLALGASESLQAKVRNAYFNQKQKSSLPRLIYSATANDVNDLVANGTISGWRDIAAAIFAYSTDKEEFSKFIVELGDRLLASSLSDRRSDALLCFLAGGALNKASTIWNAELSSREEVLKSENTQLSSYEAHNIVLTEFVEKIAAFKYALRISDKFGGQGVNLLNNSFLEFASLVSSQGQFDLALNLLENLSTEDEEIKLEIKRISTASGKTLSSRAGPRSGYVGSQSSASISAARFKSRGSVSGTTQPVLSPNVNPYLNQLPAQGQNLAQSRPSIQPLTQAPASAYTIPSARTAASSIANNPYAPKQNATNGSYSPALGVNNTIPEVPKPPTTKSRQGGSGWNDLPNNFNSSRRTTPALNASPYGPQGNQAIQPPSRTPSQMNVIPPPPQANSFVPPPPTTTATASAPKNTFEPPSRPFSAQNNPQSAILSPRQRAASVRSPVSKPHARPNRYAPAPSQTENGHSSTVSNGSGSQFPPAPHQAGSFQRQGSYQAPSNPYAPKAERRGSSRGGSFSVPPPNPYVASSVNGNGGVHGGAPAIPVANNPYANNNQNASYGQPNGPINGFVPPPPMPEKIGGLSSQNYPKRAASRTNSTAGYAPSLRSPSVQQFQAPPPPALAHQVQPPPPPELVQQVPPPAPSVQHQVSQGSQGSQAGPPAQQTRFPSGDRSHISDEAFPIYEYLSKELENVKPKIPERFTKQLVDAEKRLNILFDHLNNNELLTAPTITLLSNLSKSLADHDFKTAESLLIQITTSHNNEAGNWSVGVKRLIQMSSALSS